MEKQNPPAYGSPQVAPGQPPAQQAYPQQMQHTGYVQQPQMAAQQPMMQGQPMPMQQPSSPQMMPQQSPYMMQGQQPMQPMQPMPGQPMQQPMGQPQMAYHQPQLDGKVPVVTQQPVAGNQLFQSAMPIATLGATPAPIDCPSCHQRGMTNTSHVTGDCTHLWALGICFFTGFCCFIPYLVDSFKDVQHKCGRCGVHVATWKKSGGTQVHVFS